MNEQLRKEDQDKVTEAQEENAALRSEAREKFAQMQQEAADNEAALEAARQEAILMSSELERLRQMQHTEAPAGPVGAKEPVACDDATSQGDLALAAALADDGEDTPRTPGTAAGGDAMALAAALAD